MDKKNLSPKQQKPVARPSINKIEGLSEEALTLGWSGASGEITPSISFPIPFPFAGDDAE